MTHDPKPMPDDPDEPPVPKTLRDLLVTRLGVEPAEQPMPDSVPSPSPAAPVPPVTETQALVAVHPLRRFSLRGKASEYEARAQDTKPLLGPLVMKGQATMFYAPPNTGKTLITLHLIEGAIIEKRIDPNNLYYVNADDSSKGLSEKLRLMQDLGAHVVVPGQKGFKSADLQELLVKTAQLDAARDSCIVIDVLKRFTPLNDKKLTTEFAEACRQFVMAGGTILGLGHTTKSPNPDGTPRYAGTTDILEDFDAVYVVVALQAKADKGEKAVQFTKLKSRANSPDEVVYAYAAENGISYQERLASVRLVDPDDMVDYRTTAQVADYKVTMKIAALIDAGFEGGQMALAREAAKACGITGRKALAILQSNTGDTPGVHLWTFRTGGRGVRIYELVPPG